ncbi:MAG: ribulose kinase [Planctomycetota bacterium]|nr:ribulose kinase [Planctomycetota bacterium]
MNEKPQQEHRWLDKLVGEWTSEMECVMGPDQPPTKSSGTESVRSLGGLWTIGEGAGEMPEGGTAMSVMTLGYDPKASRFVGTFIVSVMTHMWTYSGSLDESGKVLALDAEGPSFTGEGTAKYQDRIEFVDDDHRILTSQMLGDDGEWHRFMIAHYRRKK